MSMEPTGKNLGWFKDAALGVLLVVAAATWFMHSAGNASEAETLHRQLCFECGFMYHAGDETFRTCPKFVEACGSCYPLRAVEPAKEEKNG